MAEDERVEMPQQKPLHQHMRRSDGVLNACAGVRWLICCVWVLISSLMWTAPLTAQTVHDAGQWSAIFAQGSVFAEDEGDDRLKWWFDGHYRLLDDANGFNQSIVRPGVGWSLSERTTAWVGYGWIRTSPLVSDEFDEHRLWQQLTWAESYEPFTLALRSRLEQRFVETGDDTGWRFRQLFRLQHDLPAFPRLTLVGWDELFLNINDVDYGPEAGFDQNRVFVGIGWKCRPENRWRVEIGYLNQVIYNPGRADRVNHILSVNLYCSP